MEKWDGLPETVAKAWEWVQVLLVFSLDRPVWDGKMATRFLVSAEAAGLPVTVLLNKADLVPEDEREAALAEVNP